MAFMAIVHSKLFSYLYRVANQGEARVIPQVKASKLYALPYPKYNSSDPIVTKLINECRSMLALNRRLADAKTPDLVTQLRRQTELTDRAIDQLVYEIYGLTPEEIAMVEKSI